MEDCKVNGQNVKKMEEEFEKSCKVNGLNVKKKEEEFEKLEEEEEFEEFEEVEEDFEDCEEENGFLEEDNLESNEVEKGRIAVMRSFVEMKDPSAKEVDDFMIRRFLRARDLNIDKASTMFLNYLSWKRKFLPNGFISVSEISVEISHNKMFMQGLDKKEHPIAVIFGDRHKQGSLEEFKRFCIYSLEKICARMPKGQEKFVCIADLQGWGYSNCDIRGYRASLSILQDCYPERLAKLYIIHVPSIFMKAWKIIYRFIDKKTKNKISFVDDKKLSSTLLNDIDENQLPRIYGGKMELVPIQSC